MDSVTAPVAGAWAVVLDRSGTRARYDGNEDGTIEVPTQNLGDGPITVSSKGYCPQLLAVAWPFVSDYRVQLEVATSIAGRVQDMDGTPPSTPGAYVIAIDRQTDDPLRPATSRAMIENGVRCAEIADDGSFLVHGVEVGRRYRLHLAGGGLCDDPERGGLDVVGGADGVGLTCYFLGGAKLELDPPPALLQAIPRFGVDLLAAPKESIRATAPDSVRRFADNNWSVAFDRVLSRRDATAAWTGRILFCAPFRRDLDFTLDYALSVPLLGRFEGSGRVVPMIDGRLDSTIEVRLQGGQQREYGTLQVALTSYPGRWSSLGAGGAMHVVVEVSKAEGAQQRLYLRAEPGVINVYRGIPVGEYSVFCECRGTGSSSPPVAVEIRDGEPSQADFDLSELSSIGLNVYRSSGADYTGKLTVMPCDLGGELGSALVSRGSMVMTFDAPPYVIGFMQPGVVQLSLYGFSEFGTRSRVLTLDVPAAGHGSYDLIIQ